VINCSEISASECYRSENMSRPVFATSKRGTKKTAYILSNFFPVCYSCRVSSVRTESTLEIQSPSYLSSYLGILLVYLVA